MAGQKESLLEHLERIAFFLDLQGENVFKIKAFKTGIEILGGLDEKELFEKIVDGSLIEAKGIGKGILAVCQEFLKGGSSSELQRVQENLPEGLFDWRNISGLGPKKIKAIYQSLGISTLGELEYACRENRLVNLPGFGEKSQTKIRAELQALKNRQGKYLLADALATAEEIESKIPKNVAFDQLGDLGAKRPIVEEFKYLVVYHTQKPSLQLVGQKQPTDRINDAVKNKEIRFKTKDGFPCLFLFRKPEERVTRAIFETSHSDHWQSLVNAAQKKNLELNEDHLGGGESPKSEEEFYERLGLPFHRPEQRELTARSSLEKALHEDDLVGVFHAHTLDSDGDATLEQMAKAAKKRQWKYLGISEHSKTASYAHGMEEARLTEQWNWIDEWNEKTPDFKILKGIESDILKDGSLDYSDKILKKFDFVIASIHARYGQKEMTDRLLRAIENPATTMIGHISGRLLLSREAYDFDRQKVVEAAIKHKVVIELNCNPHRLDMDWSDLVWACEKGLLISVNPDAHSPSGFDDVRFGIWMARKALVPKAQIINTWPIEKLYKFLNEKKSA